MNKDYPSDHIVSFKTNTFVWLALLLLLGITISVSKMRLLGEYSVLAALLIASAKTALVLAFFMHLKYEGRFLKRLLFLAIAALTMIIALTFADVWYR